MNEPIVNCEDSKDEIGMQYETTDCMSRTVSKNVSLRSDSTWDCQENLVSHLRQQCIPRTLRKDLCSKDLSVMMASSQLPAGSLVLVKGSTWPWWPAILSLDPSSEQYALWDREGHVLKYHDGEFLGDPHSRFWASAKKVELFPSSCPKPKRLKGVLKKSYEKAVEEAVCVQGLECKERLVLCHFKPKELLCKAKMLMNSIELMTDQCSTKQPAHHCSPHQQLCNKEIQEFGDFGENLIVIQGFIFLCASRVEDLSFGQAP